MDVGRLGKGRLTLQAEAYEGEVGQVVYNATTTGPPYVLTDSSRAQIGGGHVLGRWRRRFGDRSELGIQAYYDRFRRAENAVRGTIQNADVDLQHRFQLGSRQEVVWGLGYRFTRDDYEGGPLITLDPPSSDAHLLSGFVHHDTWLARESARLTLGCKLEHNTYSGLEIQPNARLWFSPSAHHAIWVSASRASRIPSRSEHHIHAIFRAIPPEESGVPLTLLVLTGNPDFTSEHLRALELGYRAFPRKGLSLDVAAFCNSVDRFRTNEPDPQSLEVVASPLHIRVPVRVDNLATARACGVEAALDWQVSHIWRIRGTYSYLHMDVETEEHSGDATVSGYGGDDPDHLASLRVQCDLSAGLELDLTGRMVSALPAQDIGAVRTLDARLGWRPGARVEVAIVGRNLLDSPRGEYVSYSSGVLPARVQAGVHASILYRF